MLKNEYHITYPLLRRWSIENMFHGINLVFFIFWIFMALGTALFCVVADAWLSPYLILFIFCLYRAFLRNIILAKIQYKKLLNEQNEEKKPNIAREILFDKNEIIVSQLSSKFNYSYGSIKTIKEKGNCIWLCFKNSSVLRLYKDSFINTDWDKCRDFIYTKNPDIKLS